MNDLWNVLARTNANRLGTVTAWLVLGLVTVFSSAAAAQTGSLSGHISRQADGAPVSGATVTLYQGEDPNIADEDAWWWVSQTYTEADGAYRFDYLAPRRYRVQVPGQNVSGTNYFEVDLYNVQVLSGSETANMDLQLRQAGLLYGYVKTTGGEPIQNATLVLEGDWTEHGQDWYETWTDGSGRYDFYVAPSPGKFYTVYVADTAQSGTDYASSWHGEFYKAVLAGTRVPDYALGLGGAVRGRVVNESGVGIEGVHIEVGSNPQGRWLGPWTQTDWNGDFLLRSVAPGTNYVVASNGWNEIEQGGVKYQIGEAHTGALNVPVGGTVDVNPFIIYRAGIITGVVTDEAGQPVVGAEIELDGRDVHGDEAYRESVVTDAFGQYTLDYVAPGMHALSCKKDGFLPAGDPRLSVARGQHVDRDLVLKTAAEGASLQGKITNYATIGAKDSQGVPLPWYDDSDYDEYEYPYFGLLAFSMGQDWTEQDFLDCDKRFIGTQEMSDIEDGYGDYFATDGSEVVGRYRTWLLPPGDVALCMHYQDQEGGHPGDAWSALLGGWKRLNLSKGDVRTGLDFTWEVPANPGILKGNLNVPADYTNLPHGWCWIYAFRLDANGNVVNPMPMGDAVASSGWTKTYEFRGLAAGDYTLRAYARSLASVVVGSVIVGAGQTTTRDITFRVGGTVSGQVTNGTVPLVGATMTVVETGATAMTGPSGNYSIVGLNTGAYTVTASAAGYAPAQAGVKVTAGSTTTQNFTLSTAAGSIAGTVKDPDGANVNGATVLAYNETDRSQRSTTTVGGAFTVAPLTPGNYVLAVDTDRYGVVVYPASGGRITLSPSQDVNGVAIVVGSPVPPAFSVRSSVSGGTPTILSMEFSSSRDLLAPPAVTLVEGQGALGGLTSNSALNRFEIQYTADANDNLVRIQIQEITALVPGNPGSKTFSFEVGSSLVMTNTTNVTNATGGTASMMGTQDNTQVYVPPFAIAGVEDSYAVPLTIERYGDPGDPVAGGPGQSVTAVYDFSFDTPGAQVDQNHTFTVTMSFQLPSGMTQQEFESSLVVKYFDAGDQQWKTDGISNVRINWVNQTIMFEVSHLSKFAGFLPGEVPILHDWNGDGIRSIVGDVPPFVQCVYFGNCPGGVDPVTIGDCNHDGFISIIGDVPCFVECVYFGNCPE